MELNIFLHSFLNPSFHCNLTVVYKYIHIFQNNDIYFGTCEYFKGIMLEDSIFATKCNWMHSNAVLGYCSILKCLCWLFIGITCLRMVYWHLWTWRIKQRFRGLCVLYMTKVQNSIFLFSISVYPTAKSMKGKHTRCVA